MEGNYQKDDFLKINAMLDVNLLFELRNHYVNVCFQIYLLMGVSDSK